MRLFLMLIAPLALIGAAVTAAQQRAPLGIEGAVMRAGAADPIRNATVKLLAPGGGAERQTTTDAAGRFYYPGVAAGTYFISAVRDGFDGLPATITLVAGKAVDPVRIEMIPRGVITGRVTDERGNPAGHVTVAAQIFTFDGCQRVLTPALTTTTNDLGEYHLAWLRPARYYISAVEAGFDDTNRISPLFPAAGLRGGNAARVPREGEALYEERLSARVVLNNPPGAGKSLTRVPTYSPNTPDWREAAPIDVQPGSENANVNVAEVPPPPLRHVRGGTTDQAGKRMAAALRLVNPSLGVVIDARTNTDGSFDIPVFLPGRYLLYASSGIQPQSGRGGRGQGGQGGAPRGGIDAGALQQRLQELVAQGATAAAAIQQVQAEAAAGTARGGAQANTPATPSRLAASIDFDFRDRDIDDLLVTLSPEELHVSGHLRIETRIIAASSGLGAIRLTLRPDPCSTGAPEYAVDRVNPGAAATPSQFVVDDADLLNASFSNLSVSHGRYRVYVEPLLRPAGAASSLVIPGNLQIAFDALQNAYVKSIRMGEVDVLTAGLDLRNPPLAPLTIEIGMNPGMLKGRVLTAGGRTASGATVVLIPESGLRFHAAHPFASTDAAGQFEIRAIPPGDYKAFAWDNIQNGAWQDPEFIRGYEARGTPIHINEGKNSERDVVAIPSAP